MDNQSRRTADPLAIVIAAGVPAAIVFFLNPLLIAWSNLQDMEVPVDSIAGGAFVATLAVFAAGCAVLWVAERAGWHRLVPLAMAAGVMVWLHSAVFVWDYGVMDGTNIDWREHRVAGIAEVLLWVFVLTAAVRRPAVVRQIGRRVLPALLLVHGANVALAGSKAPEAPSFHSYSLATENKHAFSSERNVILIVLDAFQSDVFARLLHENPQLADEFEGFTYYPNAVAGFSKTYPSPALMLTGEFYENKEPLPQFLERVYLENSVPAKLVAAGWDVGLYPYVSRTLHFDPKVASNIRRQAKADSDALEVAELLDLGLFRAVPHVLKREVVNRHEWQFRRLVAYRLQSRDDALDPDSVWRSAHPHRDVRQVEELERNGLVAIDRPAFRYFHFLSPHAPFLLNENFEMENLEAGHRGYYRSSLVALKLLARVFDKLRDLGVYDDAAILVVSDHGGGEYGGSVDGGTIDRPVALDYDDELSAFEHGSGLPLMLLKQPRVRGTLRISDAPVSLGDVAATLDALTVDSGEFPGKPVFEVAESEQRERRYLFYKFDGWSSEYLPPLKEFLVDGFAWDTASWRATGKTYEGAVAPAEDAAVGDSLVPTNRYVSTADRGQGVHVLGEGWWSPERDFTWSRGKRSTLDFRFDNDVSGSLLVTLRLAPHLGRGALEKQRVIVRHEGREVAAFDAAEYSDYKFLLNVGAERSNELQLELDVPDAISPAQLLTGADERVLGVGLYGFRIDSVSPVREGDVFLFGASDSGVSLLRDGWSVPESRFTWSLGLQSQLQLPLAGELHGGSLKLAFQLRPFVAAPKLTRQRVVVSANGRQLDEWRVDEPGEFSVVVPAVVTAEGVLDLTLHLPDATVAFTVTDTKDMRRLGIALFELEVETMDN